jgi:hypothetical protein
MKFVFSFIIVILSFNYSIAQDSCKNKSCKLKHGIQFQITDLLNISNYRGYTLAYRYLLNEENSLRFGFKVNYNNQEDDRLVKTDGIEEDSPYETSNLDIKLSTQYLTTIFRFEQFSFIIGGGPFVSIYDLSSEYMLPREDYVQENVRNENGISFGIDLVAGVEYWLAKNVVISGESGIYFAMNNSEYEKIDNLIYEDESLNQINEVTADSKRTRIDDLSVNLGISVFF